MNHSPHTESYTDKVTAGPGGAMTDEVGIINGDLTVQIAGRRRAHRPGHHRQVRASRR